MAKVTSRALGRSSAYGLIAQIWRVGSRFVLTPFVIGLIGLEGYGVWTLLFTLCAYVSVVETNFGVAYAKFTGEYDAKREYGRLAEILASGTALVGSVALAALTVLWLYRVFILTTLGVPSAMLPQATPALLLLSVSLVMRMSIGCLLQVLAGLQRFDLRYKMGILASAVEFIVSIGLLCRGWGLLGLAVGYFCGQAVAMVAAWWLCRRLCPELRLTPSAISLWGLRRIVSLGVRFQVLSVMSVVIQQGVKCLISGLFGVAMLGVYEIAYKLLSLGAAAGGAVVAPLMPAFANLHASEGRARSQVLFEAGSKIVSIVSIPCFAFLAIFADRLIVLWTAHEYPLSAWTIRCMAIAFIPGLIGAVGTAALRGRGMIGLELACSGIIAALFAIVCVPGYWLWGYKGIIVAFMTSAVAGSSWFIVAFARRESLDVARFLRVTFVRPLMVLGPVIAATAILAPLLRLHLLSTSRRLCVLLDVGLWGAVFGLGVAACVWFGVLSGSERGYVVRLLAPIRRKALSSGA